MSSDIAETRNTGDAALLRLARLIEPGSLLEATPECLVVAHDDGRIVFANRRAETLTGYSRDELVGQPVELLIACDLRDRDGRHARRDALPRTGWRDDPRRGPPGLDRRSRAVPGRHAPRHDRASGRPRGALRGRGEVPGTRRADPRRRLPGSRRREQGQHLREPPGDRAARDRSAGVAGRSLLLAQPHPRGRHRPGVAGVRGRLQQPRPAEPRVPDAARGRHGEVGAGAGVSDRRRGREAVADPGRDLRHHRAQARRGADRVPGLPRQADRPAEPGALRGDARERPRAGAPARPGRRRALLGPGQLQAGERLARTPGRRRAAGPAGGTPQDLHARDRSGGPSRAATSSCCCWQIWSGGAERSSPIPMPALLVAESVAERVREALEQPFDLDGAEFLVSASIGISLYPQDASDAETLLRNADAAMYRSKEFERGRHVVFASSDDDPAHRLSFSTRLRQAVAEQNWVLALPADRGPGGRQRGLGGGARPLAAAERRPGGARRVHPARRGDGPDPGDRRLGPGRVGATARRVARAGPATEHRLQPVAQADVDGAPGGAAARQAGHVRRGAGRHHDRDHRVDRHGRSGPDAAPADRPARRGASRWRSTTSGPATRRSPG